jgi:hypothetical protein
MPGPEDSLHKGTVKAVCLTNNYQTISYLIVSDYQTIRLSDLNQTIKLSDYQTISYLIVSDYQTISYLI